MKISEIAAVIEKIAPLALAQDWDNVGLLTGDPDKEIGSSHYHRCNEGCCSGFVFLRLYIMNI